MTCTTLLVLERLNLFYVFQKKMLSVFFVGKCSPNKAASSFAMEAWLWREAEAMRQWFILCWHRPSVSGPPGSRTSVRVSGLQQETVIVTLNSWPITDSLPVEACRLHMGFVCTQFSSFPTSAVLPNRIYDLKKTIFCWGNKSFSVGLFYISEDLSVFQWTPVGTVVYGWQRTIGVVVVYIKTLETTLNIFCLNNLFSKVMFTLPFGYFYIEYV